MVIGVVEAVGFTTYCDGLIAVGVGGPAREGNRDENQRVL